jgi:hypothetical protein
MIAKMGESVICDIIYRDVLYKHHGKSSAEIFFSRTGDGVSVLLGVGFDVCILTIIRWRIKETQNFPITR